MSTETRLRGSAVFLHPTRKTFYRRVYIPRKIRQHFKGRVEVRRSLKTADTEEADLRASEFAARTKRLFVTLKREGDRMTQAQIDRLVSKWLDSELDEAEDYRAFSGPLSDNDRDNQLMGLSILQEESYEALMSCDYRKIAAEADELLKSAGLPLLDHAGVEFGRLCRRLLIAKQEYATIEAERWNGVYPSRAAQVAPPVAPQVATPVQPKGPLFSETVKLFFKENARAKRTDAQVQAEFERFLAVIGWDRAIDAITKADCRSYKETLLQTRKLSLTTCIKHMSNLSGVFQWSERQGFIPDGTNPVKGLAPSKKQARKAARPRRPFTDAELLTVFSSKEFTDQREASPARYWLLLICLFEVCRREEAGQLE